MTIKIDKKIIGVEVVKSGATPDAAFKPYDRPPSLAGWTYRVRPPTMSAALYITINELTPPDGRARPFEIFLKSKDTTHEQWMTALTRTASAVFRHPIPFEWLIEEWEQTVDPNGSYFITKGDPGGRGRCNGIVAHIGRVLREHCMTRGLMAVPMPLAPEVAAKREKALAAGVKGQLCQKCSVEAVYVLDGCATCTSCGDSKCG